MYTGKDKEKNAIGRKKADKGFERTKSSIDVRK